MNENKPAPLPQVPEWYMSTQGPVISSTLKYVIALTLPFLHNVIPGLNLGSEMWDNLIDAALVLILGIGILYHNYKARKTLGSIITKLKEDNTRLASIVEKK